MKLIPFCLTWEIRLHFQQFNINLFQEYPEVSFNQYNVVLKNKIISELQ